MAFKEVTNTSTISSYWPAKASERKEGDEVVGKYTKTISRTRPDGGEDKLHLLETKDGTVGVNSYATIDRAIGQIPEGSTVKIVFNGKQTSQKTGRQYCDFKVYVDEDESSDEDVSELPTDF